MQEVQGTINLWYDAFMLDRRIRQVSPGTIRFYSQKLKPFSNWCAGEDVIDIEEVTPNHLRLFLVYLEENGNNAGGRHAYYRAIRSFLNFYELEEEPENWKNPIRKVAAPRRPERPLDPVSMEEVSNLVGVCDVNTFYGCRDKAIFMLLLDCGCRAQELLDINIEDVNLIDGSIQIRKGKGSKVRTVFIGKKTKRALRLWLKKRPQNAVALFSTQRGDRLKYNGLRHILKRRSEKANVSNVSAHDFRRAFCLGQLQAGVPETTIARFMGHSNTQLIAVYAKQTTRNLQEVFHSISDSEL